MRNLKELAVRYTDLLHITLIDKVKIVYHVDSNYEL